MQTAERLKFAFASYNAGYGNVLRPTGARLPKHGEIKRWDQLAPHAPTETGRYVSRIESLMQVGD